MRCSKPAMLIVAHTLTKSSGSDGAVPPYTILMGRGVGLPHEPAPWTAARASWNAARASGQRLCASSRLDALTFQPPPLRLGAASDGHGDALVRFRIFQFRKVLFLFLIYLYSHGVWADRLAAGVLTWMAGGAMLTCVRAGASLSSAAFRAWCPYLHYQDFRFAFVSVWVILGAFACAVLLAGQAGFE